MLASKVKVLVTGGCGFIGSNFVRHILTARPDWYIINLDKLTYAGNLENLVDLANHPNYRFVHGDICDGKTVEAILRDGIDLLVNFAAESHVDRSLYDPAIFIKTNIGGTQVLLEQAVKHKVKRFLQVSTDEVYGDLLPHVTASETSPLRPSNPYAASKAAADLLVLSFQRTFELEVLVTRCGNNYGPYQFPEKLIPLFTTNALENKPLPLYGDGLNLRDWIYVLDHCCGIELVLEKGKPGNIYNISARTTKTNREITRTILNLLQKPVSLVQPVKDRPGHDRRYANDPSKIEIDLGFSPRYRFEEALALTVRWYQENRAWWQRVKSGEYQKFYEKHYEQRQLLIFSDL